MSKTTKRLKRVKKHTAQIKPIVAKDTPEIATKLKFLIDENIIKKEIFVKNIQNEFYDRKINKIQ